MEQYRAYKNSSIPWIGEIPTSWDIHRLKNDFTIVAGATPTTSNCNYWGGNINWITPADYSSGQHYVSSGRKTITEAGLGSCPTSLVPKGSIVVSSRAPIGLVAITDNELCTNQGCKSLVNVNPNINSEFVYWYLLVQDDTLNNLGRGTTFLELSAADLGCYQYPIPPLKEQYAIADYLNVKTTEIDGFIADNERAIELLREYQQSIIFEAVTKGLDADAPMKDSGVDWIGKIPEKWSVARLDGIAVRKSGHTPDKKVPEYWDGEIVWISLADSQRLRENKYINDSATLTTPEGIAHSSAELLPAGAVLLSRDASVGLTAIAGVPLAVSQHFMAYICGDDLYNEFLRYVFIAMHQEFEKLSMGSTIPTIGLPLIKKLTIPLPSRETQNDIVSYLDKKTTQINSLIADRESMIDKLREYRKSIISEAVTGKFKVPGVDD